MKCKVIFFLLLTAVIITANPGTPQLSPWDAWRMAYTSFEQGEEFRDKGEYTKAKNAFDKALAYYNMVREKRPDWNQKVISERIADCKNESRRMSTLLGPSVSTKSLEKEERSRETAGAADRENKLRKELSEAKAELEELRRRNEVRKNYESEISNLLRDQRTLHERYSLLEKRFRAQEEKLALPDQRVQELESRLVAMRLQLDLARKENAAARKQSAAADAGRIALEKEKKELENAGKQLAGVIDAQKQQINEKNTLLERLERNLKSAEKSIAQLNNSLNSSKSDTNALRRDLDSLRAKYREALATAGGGERANRKLLEENKKLQESNNALRNAEQQSSRQSARLQRETEDLRTKLSEEIAKNSTTSRQLKEKNSRLESLNAEVNREKANAAILARELESMRNSANNSAAELKQLMSDNTELKKRLKFRESKDFKNLTAARNARKKMQDELRKYEEQIAALRSELKMNSDKFTALERSGRELQSENRKLHAERINYEDRLKSLSAASLTSKELLRQYSELKANFNALQAENRQNKLAAEAAKPREAELASIKLRLAELDGLKQQLRREQSFNEQLNAVKNRLEQELRQLRAAGKENAELKAQLADYKIIKSEVERLRKLSAELSGAQQYSAQIAELKMQIAKIAPEAAEAEKLRKQNQELLQGKVLWENESSKQKLQLAAAARLQEEMEKLRQEIAQKDKSLREADKKLSALAAEKRELANKADALETLRARTGNLVADQAKTLERLRSVEEENRRLKAAAAAKTIITQLPGGSSSKTTPGQKDSKTIIAELLQENTLLKSVNAKNVNLEQSVAEMRIHNNRMRTELEQLRPVKAEAARLSGELKKYTSELEKLKRENNRLFAVSAQGKQIEAEKSRILQLNRELSDRSLRAESELASVKSELANYSKLRTEVERLRKLAKELADAKNLAPQLAQAKLQIAHLEQLRDELIRQRALNEDLTQKKAELEKELASRPMPAFAPADYTPVAAAKPVGKPEDYIAAARIASADEKYELAIWNYRTALKLAPDNTEAAELLGKLLALRGDYKGAAPLLSKARNAKPNSIELALETAYAYIALKRYGNAEAVIEPLFKRNRENPYLQMAAGLIAAGNGQHARASGLFQLAAARLPKDPQPKLEQARLLCNTDPNRIFEAVKLYETARRLGAAPDLELEPKLAPMLNKRSNMSNFLSSAASEAARNKDWNSVIWYNRQLIDLDREPEKYRPRLAFAQYKKGLSGAALETLSMGANTPLSLLLKAYIHLQRKEKREALQSINQAKSMNHNAPIEIPADWREFQLEFRQHGRSLFPFVK